MIRRLFANKTLYSSLKTSYKMSSLPGRNLIVNRKNLFYFCNAPVDSCGDLKLKIEKAVRDETERKNLDQYMIDFEDLITEKVGKNQIEEVIDLLQFRIHNLAILLGRSHPIIIGDLQYVAYFLIKIHR